MIERSRLRRSKAYLETVDLETDKFKTETSYPSVIIIIHEFHGDTSLKQNFRAAEVHADSRIRSSENPVSAC